MSKIEEEVINSLITNIKNNLINNTENSIPSKNLCAAAVRYNTIGEAYRDIGKNITVYLVKEDKNNISKINAYTQCSKSIKSGEKLCHLHCRMIKTNEDGLKIFEKDIVPQDDKDKTKWLANINDNFFENMGKRGAKKKNNSNMYTFTDPLDPILLILNHKNAKLYSRLRQFSVDLLEGIIENKSIKYRENIIKKDNINDLINSIQSDDYETVQSSEDNSISSEDESEYIHIYTHNNENYFLDKNNFEVYRSDDESEEGGTNVTNIGILKETSYENHILEYENKYYSILKEKKIGRRGIVYLSIFNDIIYDSKMNHIGKITERIYINKNEIEYKFEFLDEI